MFNKKSEIVFIGAGKVAYTLIPALIGKNYNVKGVVSRKKESASSAGRKFKLDFYSFSFNKIRVKQGVFFITVPDNQISNAAKKLALLKLNFKESLFIHTSGSESSSALIALQKKGGLTASFHIMQTFPSLKQTSIANSFAAIETPDKKAESFLISLAKSMHLKPFRLNQEEKVYCHMAGVFTSNFLNANFFASGQILDETVIGKERLYSLFEPIIKTTLSNLKNNGIAESLSGPVQRGDYLTIKKHLVSLSGLKTDDKKLLLHSYISQSMVLLEIVKANIGKLTAGQDRVKKLLETELKKI